MTIQDHTKSSTSMMIIKLDQQSIILKKSWMKKHDVNYHDYDDSISFYFDHCNHLEASEHFYSNQKTKKKVFFSKRNFSDQSEMRIERIENKEIKIFLEKINNSSKTILKRTTSIEFNKRLNERFKRLIERRTNELWRKKLKKIETSSSRILKKKSKINLFYDEISPKYEDLNDESESAIEIHSIAIVSFNTLCRQKNVEIFVVFIKNLKIQLKKQDSNTMINSRSVISFENQDFLDVFFKKKADVLSSHRKHDHRIKLEKDHEADHEYASLYNLSEEKLLLIKKYLKEHLNKDFIESSIAFYASLILFAKKSDDELRFCVNYKKLNVIIKKNKYSISLIAEIITRLSVHLSTVSIRSHSIKCSEHAFNWVSEKGTIFSN
jgi:hypothetical protein